METELGLHDTLPLESGGKKSTYDIKLNNTVSFPRLCKDTYNKLGAKPKQRHNADNGSYVTSPAIKLTNRFLPLSSQYNMQRENYESHSRTVSTIKATTLVLGDGALSSLNQNKMITSSYPSATVNDITNVLPKELAKNKGVTRLIVHVGAVDIRNGQSEILKQDFNKLFECLDKVAIPTFISGPLPNIDRRINKFSRLLQLNTWLSEVCEPRGLHFIDNFNIFWQRDDLFKGKGPHLNRGGVRRLMDNFLHALSRQRRPLNRPEKEPVLPPRKERSERRAPTLPFKGPAEDSPSTTSAKDSPPQDPGKDLATANSAAATLPPPLLHDWVPNVTSTPTRDFSQSFSSPASPMGLPNHLESLVKSGTKAVPHTPVMMRSRIPSPKKKPAPSPPQKSSSTKVPPARPPPPVSTAVISSSLTAAV